MGLSLLDGNEAVAWGAHAAGCGFFAGYPITPATGIFNLMSRILPPSGGIVMQGEDEIASIGFCLGASMAGLKVMTATSGPGISLYSEHISFAVGSEIPIVIVDVQRLGPSTGSATKGADGDILFMRWGNSGGLPVIVLSPANVRDCYTLTIEAFNLAERFRCPVFLASNKEIGMTRESVDFSKLPVPAISERRPPEDDKPFLPFEPISGTQAPYFLPIGHDTLVRQTSSTHGKNGYITTDPGQIAAGIRRLKDKLEANISQYSFFEFIGDNGADTLIITYGVSARAARTAVRHLKDKGKTVSLLILKTLWPVPSKIIEKYTQDVKRVLVVEMNLGQYFYEVERSVKPLPVELLGRMDGRLISPQEIEAAI